MMVVEKFWEAEKAEWEEYLMTHGRVWRRSRQVEIWVKAELLGLRFCLLPLPN